MLHAVYPGLEFPRKIVRPSIVGGDEAAKSVSSYLLTRRDVWYAHSVQTLMVVARPLSLSIYIGTEVNVAKRQANGSQDIHHDDITNGYMYTSVPLSQASNVRATSHSYGTCMNTTISRLFRSAKKRAQYQQSRAGLHY